LICEEWLFLCVILLCWGLKMGFQAFTSNQWIHSMVYCRLFIVYCRLFSLYCPLLIFTVHFYQFTVHVPLFTVHSLHSTSNFPKSQAKDWLWYLLFLLFPLASLISRLKTIKLPFFIKTLPPPEIWCQAPRHSKEYWCQAP
jgi:hypothetical protein